MSLLPFAPSPGLNLDDTDLAASGGWVDGDLVRFRGTGKAILPEAIGGWASLAGIDPVPGMCRDIHGWAGANGRKWLALASADGVFVADIDNPSGLVRLTPWASPPVHPTAQGAITTTTGQALARLTWPAHGLVQGQRFYVSCASAGDIWLNPACYNISDALQTSQGSVDVVVAHANHGYHTGDVVSVVYVEQSPQAVGGVTVGGLYTIRVIDSASYAIALETAATATARGGGSIWVGLAASYRVASVVDANTIAFRLTSPAPSGQQSSYVGYVAGELALVPANASTGTGGYSTGGYGTGGYGDGVGGQAVLPGCCLATMGTDLLINPQGGSLYRWRPPAYARAARIAAAPASIAAMFVSTQGHVVALGTEPEGVAKSDPMCIRWSDLANADGWNATAATQAGDRVLTGGSRLVAGRPGRGVNLVWSDTSLFAMRYLGDPLAVFGFERLGDGCGLIGPNAALVLDGQAFWMGPADFFTFAGGAVAPLPSTLRRWVFGGLNRAAASKITGFVNRAFGEVWWFFPRDGAAENNAYVAFHVQNGHWTKGTLNRTAALGPDVTGWPILVDGQGQILAHELGDTANSLPLRAWIESAPVQLDTGDRLLHIRQIVPDFTGLTNGSLTLKPRLWPQQPGKTLPPLPVDAQTRRISCRATGRQLAVRFEGVGAWRWGAVRLDIVKTGQVR